MFVALIMAYPIGVAESWFSFTGGRVAALPDLMVRNSENNIGVGHEHQEKSVGRILMLASRWRDRNPAGTRGWTWW